MNTDKLIEKALEDPAEVSLQEVVELGAKLRQSRVDINTASRGVSKQTWGERFNLMASGLAGLLVIAVVVVLAQFILVECEEVNRLDADATEQQVVMVCSEWKDGNNFDDNVDHMCKERTSPRHYPEEDE